MIRLAGNKIDAVAQMAAFVGGQRNAGAIASFTGIVRPDDGARALFIDYHPVMTLQAIEGAAAEAQSRWLLDDLLVAHRTGEIEVGGVIVLVAAASAHRRAAFEACDFLMDFLKTDAPFWKKEIRDSGARWIEPRAEDYDDRLRWKQEG